MLSCLPLCKCMHTKTEGTCVRRLMVSKAEDNLGGRAALQPLVHIPSHLQSRLFAAGEIVRVNPFPVCDFCFVMAIELKTSRALCLPLSVLFAGF